jgi:hypothetical protein
LAVSHSVYCKWDNGSPIDRSELELVTASFRPDDPGACVWVEPDAPGVLCESFEVEAVSDDDAKSQGRSALDATSDLLSGHLLEVVVMTNERQVSWSP